MSSDPLRVLSVLRGEKETRTCRRPQRVQQLIEQLGLIAHPEGGHFRETFRSEDMVLPGDGRGERAALTSIYFLLAAGEMSVWHRVKSDETWHYYEGGPLELWVAPADFSSVQCHMLGPLSDSAAPVQVVPAGWWQAARPVAEYTLVGCTVGPGFDFSDFTLLRDLPEQPWGLGRMSGADKLLVDKFYGVDDSR